ncbi:hypothetical protein P0D71_08235 [Paraburkholderia sp. RL17-383-BIF-A]|uniref:hypothetical protein n=1 Tax=Paraburkholderia sp. RL17-383-BIF-A TaxID=3031631 RepID=UPI0038BCA5FA
MKNMTVRKKNESTGNAPAVSVKSRLQEVQRVLDLVRSQIRKFDFTPEQVFGYQAKADAANLKDEVLGQAPVLPAAKKTAARKTAAVKRTASGGATARKTGERGSTARRVAGVASVAEDTPPATPATVVKTSLNPAAAWPFPTGSRP